MLLLFILLAVAYGAGVLTPVLMLRAARRVAQRQAVEKKIEQLQELKQVTEAQLRALEWEREYKENQ